MDKSMQVIYPLLHPAFHHTSCPRCPFLTLSATIGNPDSLFTWLQQVKAMQYQQDVSIGFGKSDASYKAHLIVHRERYNDLQHYIYAPCYALQDLPPSGWGEGSVQCNQRSATRRGEARDDA